MSFIRYVHVSDLTWIFTFGLFCQHWCVYVVQYRLGAQRGRTFTVSPLGGGGGASCDVCFALFAGCLGNAGARVSFAVSHWVASLPLPAVREWRLTRGTVLLPWIAIERGSTSRDWHVCGIDEGGCEPVMGGIIALWCSVFG